MPSAPVVKLLMRFRSALKRVQVTLLKGLPERAELAIQSEA